MSQSILLRNCRYLITCDEAGRVIVRENTDVLVEDGVITSVGHNITPPSGCDRLRLENHVVLPGLVNAHTHAAMNVLRGYADNEELHDWLARVWEAEKKLSRDIVYKASLLACYEMLLSGVTCFQDMYYYPEETVRACSSVGMRVRTGPLCGEGRSLSFPAETPLFKPVVNIHSLYAVPLETVLRCFEEASRRGVDVHIHVSETRREVFEVRGKTGRFPVELLGKLGVLGENVVLVHLNWVTSWEADLIAEKNASVVVCPSSSMKLANSGFTPVYEFLKKNVRIGIGTDGACSANRLDILGEMRQLVLLYRHNYWDTRVRAEHAFRMATLEGYRIMRFKAGVIKPGFEADIVAVSLRRPWMKPTKNPLSLLVYSSLPGDVDYVIVRGKVLLEPSSRENILWETEELWRELEEDVETLWTQDV